MVRMLGMVMGPQHRRVIVDHAAGLDLDVLRRGRVAARIAHRCGNDADIVLAGIVNLDYVRHLRDGIER